MLNDVSDVLDDSTYFDDLAFFVGGTSEVAEIKSKNCDCPM